MYLILDNVRVEIEKFVFSGGEVSVTLPPEVFDADNIRVVSLVKNSEDLVTLLLVVNSLRIAKPHTPISATLPYIPYGRQDRVCNPGEAFSLRVSCDLINMCGFEEVITEDPHSDVTPALINNLVVREQDSIVEVLWPQIKRTYGQAVLVSPDAGSNKKIAKVCKALGMDEFIRADKVRDIKTGKILSTTVYTDDLEGQNCLIVDDICDGGMTFIKLAEELKKKGANKVGLYVTHGIFSKGKQPLKNVIDDIYTNNDWTLGEN